MNTNPFVHQFGDRRRAFHYFFKNSVDDTGHQASGHRQKQGIHFSRVLTAPSACSKTLKAAPSRFVSEKLCHRILVALDTSRGSLAKGAMMMTGNKRPRVLLVALWLTLACPTWSFYSTNVASSRLSSPWKLASSRGVDLPSALPSKVNPSTTSKSSFFAPLVHSEQNEHAMNLVLMRDLSLGQIGLWTVASIWLGIWQHLPSLLATQAISSSTSWEMGVGLAVLAVGGLIALDDAVERLVPSTTCRIEFGTINLVTALWGRRTHSDTVAFAKKTTATTTNSRDALGTTLALAALTALCQQAVFFDLIPGALLSTTQTPVIAIVLPSFLFGLFHMTRKAEEDLLLVSLHLLHGLVYMCLVAGTGALWPSILTQSLYQSHVWTTTWHKVNDQIDWAHAAPDQPPLSAHDAAVWSALESHSQGALTPSSVQVLQSIFYAFDTEHQGYLSLSNVQTAMAYTFWQQGQELPNPTRIQALFEALLDQRPSQNENVPANRLSWVEFVRLLVSLRASSRRESETQR